MRKSFLLAAAAASMAANLQAQEILVETSDDDLCILTIDPHQTFEEVVETLNEHVEQEEERQRERGFCGVDRFERKFRMHFPSNGYQFVIEMAKKPRKESRNYGAGYSSSEGSDIAYIVKTLANSSLPKIKTAESSLKKAGDRIDAVHPLQFLLCVFSKEELKVALRNLQGRSWVWKDFISGLTDTLAEENRKNNILPYLEDFAHALNVDINILLPLQEGGRWDKFVNTLIEIIPREDGSGRYNQ